MEGRLWDTHVCQGETLWKLSRESFSSEHRPNSLDDHSCSYRSYSVHSLYCSRILIFFTYCIQNRVYWNVLLYLTFSTLLLYSHIFYTLFICSDHFNTEFYYILIFSALYLMFLYFMHFIYCFLLFSALYLIYYKTFYTLLVYFRIFCILFTVFSYFMHFFTVFYAYYLLYSHVFCTLLNIFLNFLHFIYHILIFSTLYSLFYFLHFI